MILLNGVLSFILLFCYKVKKSVIISRIQVARQVHKKRKKDLICVLFFPLLKKKKQDKNTKGYPRKKQNYSKVKAETSKVKWDRED